MEESNTLKADVENIKKQCLPNEKIIGVVFETYEKYIMQKEGRDGLEKFEKKMREMGYPFYFKEIKPFEFYPLDWSVVAVVVAQEVFGWTEKDIFDWGYTAPQYSLIIRLLMRYFISIERSLAESQNNWRKHFTAGGVEYDIHKDKKYFTLRLIHNALHPSTCIYAAGYFLRIFEYVIKSSNVTIKEVKCRFKGDANHEYKIQWQ